MDEHFLNFTLLKNTHLKIILRLNEEYDTDTVIYHIKEEK